VKLMPCDWVALESIKNAVAERDAIVLAYINSRGLPLVHLDESSSIVSWLCAW
jgi:hypothetical protein